jgi:heme/copper-type cytochrome/quinol oxidase subunit 1
MSSINPQSVAAIPERRLQSIWERPSGLIGWLSTVDHKEIGKRYIVTAFIFLILGAHHAPAARALESARAHA